MKKIVLAFLLLGSLALSACTAQNENSSVPVSEESKTEVSSSVGDSQANTAESRDLFAMDTYMQLTAYGEEAGEAVDAACQEIQRLDALLSTGSETSEVTKLNRAGGGSLSEDVNCLLGESLKIYRETDGAFDITVYPMMRAWGFTDESYRVPSEEELSSHLSLVDSSSLAYDEENASVTFEKQGTEIDLGGIAKGYTSGKIMDIFRSYGIASGQVSLGGNVQVLGRKTDGTLWRVAIQNPDLDGDFLGIVSVEDRAVITSGGYERYFEQDGVTYHHILDPSTGYPADSGLTSVSIVSKDGLLADGLSTALFVMGKEKAEAYWKEHSEDFDAILYTEEGTLYITEGIEENFSSNLDVQVIRKDR